MTSLKSKDKSTIKTQQCLMMLRQIYLGGLLEECMVGIKKGKAKVEAVDITNSLIVICNKSIASKDITTELGLGNLDLLLKFLSAVEESKLFFKYKDGSSKFELTKKNKRRKLHYLLTQPELIATQLQVDEDLEDEDENEDPYQKMKNMMEYSVDLSSSFIKDFLTYIGLLKTKDVSIEFDGEEEITFVCGGTNDHKFELILSAKVEGDEGDPFNIKINGVGHINIEWSKKLIKKVIISCDNDSKIKFKLQSKIKSFRVKKTRKEVGDILFIGVIFRIV